METIINIQCIMYLWQEGARARVRAHTHRAGAYKAILNTKFYYAIFKSATSSLDV